MTEKHLYTHAKSRTAKGIYKHPKGQNIQAAVAVFMWAQILPHANAHVHRHPYTHSLHIQRALFFFFFFSSWYACCGKCVSLWVWWHANVYVGVKKKKMEKVWGMYSESQKATHRLLFIAPSWWNRETELQLLPAVPNWSLTRADKTFQGLFVVLTDN